MGPKDKTLIREAARECWINKRRERWNKRGKEGEIEEENGKVKGSEIKVTPCI